MTVCSSIRRQQDLEMRRQCTFGEFRFIELFPFSSVQLHLLSGGSQLGSQEFGGWFSDSESRYGSACTVDNLGTSSSCVQYLLRLVVASTALNALGSAR